MGRLLESSAERRFQTFRRDLTLDLFTRQGFFWERIDQIRAEWEIVAQVQLPPVLVGRSTHLPPGLEREFLQPWPIEAEERYAHWSLLLEEIHDAVVPAENRVQSSRFDSADFWDGFLSGCLVYDPPPDNLLGFADHPIATYGDYLEVLNPWADGSANAPQMLAPPIAFLHDAEDMVARERQRHQQLLEALHRRLEPSGIDVWELIYHIEYWDRPDEEGPNQLPGPKPYIDVQPHTTEADVRNAFKLMAAALPTRPRPIKPRRDRLTAVQCAVWYDDLNWSHEVIADRFGWAIQYPPGMKPRSETARQHITEGRNILRQRKNAA